MGPQAIFDVMGILLTIHFLLFIFMKFEKKFIVISMLIIVLQIFLGIWLATIKPESFILLMFYVALYLLVGVPYYYASKWKI